jgi:hypothetical protein
LSRYTSRPIARIGCCEPSQPTENLWSKTDILHCGNPGITPATSGTNGNTCGRMKPKR